MTIPVPKQRTSKVKSKRHTHDGIGVCSPKPPQTPPIQRSVSDFAKLCNQSFCVINSPFPKGRFSNTMIIERQSSTCHLGKSRAFIFPVKPCPAAFRKNYG